MTLQITSETALKALQAHRCLWCGAPALPNSRYCCKVHGSMYTRALKKGAVSNPPGRPRKVGLTQHQYGISETFMRNAQKEVTTLLVNYGLKALQAPIANPGTCQLCKQLRALDGAFCLECEADLKAVGLI